MQHRREREAHGRVHAVGRAQHVHARLGTHVWVGGHTCILTPLAPSDTRLVYFPRRGLVSGCAE